MPRIVVLGGTGHAGRLIVEQLLEHTDARVSVASRHLEAGLGLADELARRHPGRVAAVAADAADAGSLRAAFAGQDLVIVASPTTAHVQTVARAALDAGLDHLDIQLSGDKLAVLESLRTDIAAAGRCFITEAGFHPGLPSALVRYAAGRLDTITSADVISHLSFRGMPVSDAVDELLAEFADYHGQVFVNGRWTAPNSYRMRRFDLGGEIGSRRCYSMFFAELGDLPQAHPTLVGLGSYISESHWVTDWLVTPVLMAGLKLSRRPPRALGRLYWWSMTTFTRPPFHTEVQVQAAGERDARPARVRASVAHPDGYLLTALPVVAAVRQYLDGSARRPGLWFMGHLVDPERLLADLATMGADVRTE